MRKWLALVVLVVACSVGLSRASGQAMDGVRVRAYEITQVPPTRSDVLYPQCSDTVQGSVQDYWGGGAPAGCHSDWFMVHYSATLTIPRVQSVRFYLFTDDGGWANIGGEEFGYWSDRSCWGTVSDEIVVRDSVPFDLWMYENGGGACAMLYWSLDGGAWEPVPVDAFTTQTATTEAPTTSTTEPPSTTTLPVTVQQSTTTMPVVVPDTASSTTVLPSTTTTATLSTTTTTSTTSTTSTVSPAVINPTTTMPMPTTSVVSPVEPTSSLPPTTTTPPTSTAPPSNDVAVAAAIAQVASATPEQAAELFTAINEDALTPEQGAALVAAVQDAPTAIREQFESHLNVFAGATDTYIPLGSVVTVKQRRIIIAAGLILSVPVVVRKPNE